MSMGSDVDVIERAKVCIKMQSDKLQNQNLNGGWIPCENNLPEKDGLYLVSGKGKIWICKMLTLSNIKAWCDDARNPIVKAWMPLPEPWKGEFNADND